MDGLSIGRYFFTIGSDAILVFPYQTGCRYSDENPPPLTGTSNARRYDKMPIFSQMPNPSQHVPIYLQQFPSYSNRKCKKSPFSRTAAHIFSPGDAPAIITQCVARMKRQFNACQIPRSMYLSIFNSFRVIRCLSQCVSPKIAIFTTYLFPLGTPLGQSR